MIQHIDIFRAWKGERGARGLTQTHRHTHPIYLFMTKDTLYFFCFAFVARVDSWLSTRVPSEAMDAPIMAGG